MTTAPRRRRPRSSSVRRATVRRAVGRQGPGRPGRREIAEGLEVVRKLFLANLRLPPLGIDHYTSGHRVLMDVAAQEFRERFPGSRMPGVGLLQQLKNLLKLI